VIDVKMVGVRKPGPEPYLAATGALGAPAEACLFVDDMPVNCRGAEAVGMESFLFDVTDPEGSIASLLRRLEIPR
jgi:putative hydrolase of the HAD superfamily